MQTTPRSAGASLTLVQATLGFVAVGLIIAALGTVTYAREQRDAYQAAALELAARVRLQGAATTFSRGLAEDWHRLAVIASDAGSSDAALSGLHLAFSVADRAHWAGVVGVDGRTQAIIERMEIGLAGQSWLSISRNAPYVGVVDAGQDIGGVLVMARPLQHGAAGDLLVVVMPVEALSNDLEVVASALGMTVFLLSANPASFVASEGLSSDTLRLASLRSAAAGIASTQREVWPDGQTYFTSVLPLRGFGGAPRTGLQLLGRISPAEFDQADRSLREGSARLVAALLAAIAVLTLMFVRTFIAPFRTLAENAERIQEGADEYPYEGRQTRELASLSATLARKVVPRIPSQDT